MQPPTPAGNSTYFGGGASGLGVAASDPPKHANNPPPGVIRDLLFDIQIAQTCIHQGRLRKFSKVLVFLS
jgi:hypothetical protein